MAARFGVSDWKQSTRPPIKAIISIVTNIDDTDTDQLEIDGNNNNLGQSLKDGAKAIMQGATGPRLMKSRRRNKKMR